MSLLKRFLPSFRPVSAAGPSPALVRDMLDSQRRRVEPQLPPPTPYGKQRIHLFAGHFATEALARFYCFHDDGDRPAELMRDLPDAYIDPTHVEVCYENSLNRLSAFLLPADAAAMHRRMGDSNTLVIIAEPAFAGLAYALNDTSRLTYLGPLVVKV